MDLKRKPLGLNVFKTKIVYTKYLDGPGSAIMSKIKRNNTKEGEIGAENFFEQTGRRIAIDYRYCDCCYLKRVCIIILIFIQQRMFISQSNSLYE